MKLLYKRTHPDAKPPKFAHDGDACFDLTAATKEVKSARTVLYDTGLIFDTPNGYALKAFSRSGHGFKFSMRLANGTGIIDAGYRDTVKILLTYDGPEDEEPKWPEVGERIAQARLEVNIETDLVEVDDIDTETERGTGGLGSSGA